MPDPKQVAPALDPSLATMVAEEIQSIERAVARKVGDNVEAGRRLLAFAFAHAAARNGLDLAILDYDRDDRDVVRPPGVPVTPTAGDAAKASYETALEEYKARTRTP